MTPKEAEKKYGKEMIEKMKRTGYLDGITISFTNKGEPDVPDEDYERAYRAAKGGHIIDFD